MKNLIILYLLLIGYSTFAQVDSSSTKKIKYTPDFKFMEGIYLRFDQVISNQPIQKSRIESPNEYNDPQYFEKLMENDKLYIFDNLGTRQEIKTKDIWGYCSKGIIFINYNGDLNRVSFIGNLCHFISNVTIQNTTYDPYMNYNTYNYNAIPPTTTEMRQYILKFDTGEILEYDYKSLEICLMKDPTLYDEYNALSKKKKRQMIFFYMRKFNERNPLYIPVN